MINIKEYDNKHMDEWNLFNKCSKNGLFMFDRNYMDYHSDRFIDNSLMFYEKNKLIAILPCNISDNILYSHSGLTFGGFVVDDNMRQRKMLDCFEILKNYMRDKGIDSMLYKAIPYIYHKKPAQEDMYALFINNAKLYRVDCSTTIALKDMIKFSNLRARNIKKALKNNVIVEESNDFECFVGLLNDVLQERHNTKAVHIASELKLLKDRFQTEIKLFFAKKDSDIIAATLIFVYDNIIHTQYLASNAVGRETGALDLLIYTLIQTYAHDKMYFDFGISTENNGYYLNEGLISQKEGFGARSITHSFYRLMANTTIDNQQPVTTGGGGGTLFSFVLLVKIFRIYFFSLLFIAIHNSNKSTFHITYTLWGVR